jgi:hypothetical protein
LYELDVTGCMTLEEYLDHHDPSGTKRDAWENARGILDAEGYGHVRDNIERENRLSEAVWSDVCDAFLGSSPDTLLDELDAVLRRRTLHGPEIADVPSPKGRAVSILDFEDLLDTGRLSQTAIDQTVSDLRTRGSIDSARLRVVQPRNPKEAPKIGRYLIWATFQEGKYDPFDGHRTADEVRDWLSLPPPPRYDRSIVLLVYKVPEDTSVRHPTVADAYAGHNWSAQYQCTNRGEPWGYTQGGAPEVVHDVIGMQSLISTSSCPAIRLIS